MSLSRQGHPTIAQRFIAGYTVGICVKSRQGRKTSSMPTAIAIYDGASIHAYVERSETNRPAVRERRSGDHRILSPLPGLGRRRVSSSPTVETVGYFRDVPDGTKRTIP